MRSPVVFAALALASAAVVVHADGRAMLGAVEPVPIMGWACIDDFTRVATCTHTHPNDFGACCPSFQTLYDTCGYTSLEQWVEAVASYGRKFPEQREAANENFLRMMDLISICYRTRAAAVSRHMHFLW